MKITMYELLGLVKDGKIPKKIKFNNRLYTFDEKTDNYCKNEICSINWDYVSLHCLNDEVEIIEEEKKIPEKLDYIHPDISCSYNESELLLRIEANKDKINEILDYLKSKGE